MTLDDYQKQALTTAIYHSKKDNLLHWTLGLCGESGEVAEKFKKWIRDNNSDMAALDTEDLAKELGDVLWYVAVLADELGFSLDQVAEHNVAKLASRHKRNKITGSGDNR